MLYPKLEHPNKKPTHWCGYIFQLEYEANTLHSLAAFHMPQMLFKLSWPDSFHFQLKVLSLYNQH